MIHLHKAWSESASWFGAPPPPLHSMLRWSLFMRPLDSWQEMCHRHGGWHSVSSFCFAVLTQADVHPRVGHRLVSVVVVGEELLSELTLMVVVWLREKRGRYKDYLKMPIVWLRETKQRCRDIFSGGNFKSVLFVVITIKQSFYLWLQGYCTVAVSQIFTKNEIVKWWMMWVRQDPGHHAPISFVPFSLCG